MKTTHHVNEQNKQEEIKIAKLLYRLGNWSVNHKKKIVFSAIGLLIILAAVVLKFGYSFNEEMSIPNTPADKAASAISKEFEGIGNTGASAQIVFKTSDDETLDSPELQQAISELITEIKKDNDVVSVVSPMELMNITADKKVGYAQVSFKEKAELVSDKSIEHIVDSLEITRDAGIQTEVRGDSLTFSEAGSLHTTEIIGVVVAFIILAVTFVSFVAAGLPIISAVIGLGIGLITIVIGTNFIDIQSVSMSLAAMLGLAVGIDYALFIMTRFKQQLAQGYSVQQSIAIAVGTAGSAVVFAGITVIIGLLGLAVTGIPFLTVMGVSAAISILTAVIISIIVLPAILGMIGHRLSPAKENKFLQKITGTTNKEKESNKWGEFVTKRPLLVSIVGIALLAIIALPMLHMNLGLPSDGTTKSTEQTERKAFDMLSDAYGEGFNATLIVAAQVDEPSEESLQAVNDISQDLSELSGVQMVTPATPGPSGNLFVMSIIPETGPDDTKTKDLVHIIRDKSEVTEKENHIELLVTGTTAMNIDISQKLNDALPIFASLIVGLAYVLLVLVFRSLLIPLKAVLGFLLSVVATFGFAVFVVQDGNLLDLFGFPASSPILAFLPVISIGILFGLAMDYEIFLVSKMREVYAHTGDYKKAILHGMRDSGKVVTAAGLIMIAVFIGFMMAPDAMIKVVAMSLAFGVFFDAFIVRMTIVPAVMALMGNSAWYLPKWLDKILPNIDIEGESIMHELEKKKENA